MPKLSQQFDIDKTQPELDFVDVDTDTDTHLFIDPYVFSKRSDAWSAKCHESILSFFEAVLDAIRTGDHARGERLLNQLHEPNETCLGLSRGTPSGRGIGSLQAEDLFDSLRESRAAETGLLEELADCELFIRGIGPDKISDITTNIIREHLIEYTQYQCELHGVELPGTVASGNLWNANTQRWENRYVRLPIIGGRKIILVPKASVRWSLAFSHQQYYNQFVLEFLQAEHLSQGTALVETLKNGRQRVTKKSLKELHPLSKHFLTEFSENHPEVLERYKRILGVPRELRDYELEEEFEEAIFARALIQHLAGINRGDHDASRFHSFMIGALEFIFYPNLIYPEKELEIHEGRKRIDIAYTNNSDAGFFFRRRSDARVAATKVYVECKNYMKEMANPELDQLAGRFSPVRGRLGFLIGRNFDNRERFIDRCRDTARDDRGFIVAMVDEDTVRMLEMIESGRRWEVDQYLEHRFGELLT